MLNWSEFCIFLMKNKISKKHSPILVSSADISVVRIKGSANSRVTFTVRWYFEEQGINLFRHCSVEAAGLGDSGGGFVIQRSRFQILLPATRWICFWRSQVHLLPRFVTSQRRQKKQNYCQMTIDHLTIRPLSRKGFGSIAHEAKPNQWAIDP